MYDECEGKMSVIVIIGSFILVGFLAMLFVEHREMMFKLKQEQKKEEKKNEVV